MDCHSLVLHASGFLWIKTERTTLCGKFLAEVLVDQDNDPQKVNSLPINFFRFSFLLRNISAKTAI